MAATNKIEASKLQYDTLLTEYKMLRESISSSRQLQGQSDNIALAVLGISIPVILTILDRSLDMVGVILLIPILFFAIAFTQLRHERILMIAALYIDAELRPRINKLITSLSSENVELLQWEGYLSQRSWVPTLFMEWLAICTRAILGFGSGLAVIGIYAFIRLNQTASPFQSYEGWLIALNGLVLLVDLASAFGIAQVRYQYLKKTHYVAK